jgi:hypothetical protein
MVGYGAGAYVLHILERGRTAKAPETGGD